MFTYQCRCPGSHYSPGNLASHSASHSGPYSGPVGQWTSAPTSEPLQPIQPTTEAVTPPCPCSTPGNTPELPSDALAEDSLPDIPPAPLRIVWEASDDIPDDAEYVSIKATDFADMLSDLRNCVCKDD